MSDRRVEASSNNLRQSTDRATPSRSFRIPASLRIEHGNAGGLGIWGWGSTPSLCRPSSRDLPSDRYSGHSKAGVCPKFPEAKKRWVAGDLGVDDFVVCITAFLIVMLSLCTHDQILRTERRCHYPIIDIRKSRLPTKQTQNRASTFSSVSCRAQALALSLLLTALAWASVKPLASTAGL